MVENDMQGYWTLAVQAGLSSGLDHLAQSLAHGRFDTLQGTEITEILE